MDRKVISENYFYLAYENGLTMYSNCLQNFHMKTNVFKFL